jgi:hypothetical protein
MALTDHNFAPHNQASTAPRPLRRIPLSLQASISMAHKRAAYLRTKCRRSDRWILLETKSALTCAHDPDARHGPYYEWGHMKAGKLVHRMVTVEQAKILRRAIANYRQARKFMRAWERETERLIDVETSG